MTNENKPTSKVIQISELLIDSSPSLSVLCDDGSIWNYHKSNRSDGKKDSFAWQCILEANANAK